MTKEQQKALLKAAVRAHNSMMQCAHHVERSAPGIARQLRRDGEHLNDVLQDILSSQDQPEKA